MILIRHGESIWNRERRIQGNLDPGLSDRGLAQAAMLGSRLKGRSFAGLYTSPLRRALETAAVLGESVGLRPQPLDGLQEIRLGAWEGKTAAEIRTMCGDGYDRWLDGPLDAAGPPGGEGVRAFQQRAVDALEGLRKAHPDGDLLVVTHGGVIRVYLCHILGLDLNRMFRVKTDNTAVTEILFNGERADLVLLNDTCHLNRTVRCNPHSLLGGSKRTNSRIAQVGTLQIEEPLPREGFFKGENVAAQVQRAICEGKARSRSNSPCSA